MFKLWISLALLGVGISALSPIDTSVQDDFYDDFYNDELEELGVLSKNVKEETAKDQEFSTGSTSAGVLEKNDSNNDESVQAEIEQFRKDIENFDDKKEFEDINDYQFEDNRFNDKEKDNVGENIDNVQNIPSDSNDNDGSFEVSSNEEANQGLEMNPVDYEWDLGSESEEDVDNFNTNTFDDVQQNSNEEVQDTVLDDEDKLFEETNDEDKLIEETKKILNEDTENDFAEDKTSNENVSTEIILENNEILEDTKKILEETHDTIDEDNNNIKSEEVQTPDVEKVINENNIDAEPVSDDTVNKAFDDLMADLDKLHETFDKLNDVEEGNEFGYEETNESEKSLEGEDYEDIDDSNLEQIFNGKALTNTADVESINEDIVEPLPDHTLETERAKESDPILYLNDALIANETDNASINSDSTEEQTENEELKQDINDIMENTSTENDKLLKNFREQNKDLFDIDSADIKNPIYVKLNTNEPTTVTSPGYPSPYTADKVIDWLFVGVGVGIELNITDFAVNGHVGDYLLIKPGGLDNPWVREDGILFTYTINQELRYRFLDIDRLFMRFEARRGMLPMRGFSLSARMIAPYPMTAVPKPEPEPVQMPPAQSTITIHLGGPSLEDFLKVEEQFRQIVADMATLYINANGIEAGLNSTLETAQIVSKSLCYQNWPKSESCVEVQFGVPLVYEDDSAPRLDEDDLYNMWSSYAQQDPFAVRLRLLGIMEYQVPNDRGVLTVWLVIAGGVVISMAMLAFAFWRFSCFEDYTRMPSFSDSDSVNEKRKLDLYPTPHQTLPPLYAEADYKWADGGYDDCKVNVGGFSNRSYLRDDMFDIDSDEEVVPGRNRDNGISPRDIYSMSSTA